MSIIPDFKKILPTTRQTHTSRYTDGTRTGSERCPYCGGWHSTDSEMDACARSYSSAGLPYQCPRCKRYYPTLDQANRCCEEQKRYERRYDPSTYVGYTGTSGYTNDESDDDDWYKKLAGSGQSSSSGEGMFAGLFNFGSGSNKTEQQDSGGGIFDSFFNAGGKK